MLSTAYKEYKTKHYLETTDDFFDILKYMWKIISIWKIILVSFQLIYRMNLSEYLKKIQ